MTTTPVPQPNDPRSGRLVTPADFDDALKIGLDEMLRLTSNKALNCNDAWASGDTDTAFAINGFVGLQRSHASNDWIWGWVDLVKAGHGTYVYVPQDPYFIRNLTDRKVDVEEIASVPVTNSTNSTITTGVKYTDTEAHTTSITNSWEIGLKLSTDFNLLGHKFSLEASFKGGRVEANTQTTSSATEFSASVTVPAKSVYEVVVKQETVTQTRLYGLEVVIGCEHPDGGVAKAVTNRGTWDTFFRLEDILKGRERQTAQYQVDVTEISTKIELKEVTPSKMPALAGETQKAMITGKNPVA